MGTTELASLSLAELLTLSPRPQQIVAIQAGRAIAWPEFHGRVRGLVQHLAAERPGRAILSCADSYAFLVGLSALLAAGWEVFISANSPGAALRRIQGGVSLILGDAQPEQDLDREVVHPLGFLVERGEIPEIAGNVPRITLLTSGSTGEPKQIQKSISQLEREAWALERCWGSLVGSSTIFATVSHQHIYGLLFKVIWPVLSGRPFRAESVFYPEELLFELRSAGDATLVSSPAYLKRLPELVDVASLPPSLRLIFSSGGPLDGAISRKYWQAAEKRIIEILGSTETGGIAWRAQGDSSAEQPWMALPGVDIRVADESALEVSSPFIEPDGAPLWVATGDGARVGDSPKEFFLTGRLDRVVKIEEKRVSLAEIEGILEQSEFVKEAAVVTVQAGARVTLGAALVLSGAGQLQFNSAGRKGLRLELQNLLREHFDPIHVPRLWRFVEALPANQQGKRMFADVLRLFTVEAPRGPEIISESQSDQRCFVRARVPEDLLYLQGHFPDFAVVPGVIELEWVMNYLDKLAPERGPIASMENVKFHEVLLPGSEFSLEVEWDAQKKRASYLLANGDRKYSSGRVSFQ